MYPEVTSTGFYLTAIARALTSIAPVHVLCGQPTYAARGTHVPRLERWHDVLIRRCRGTTLNKNWVPGRLLNMATLGTAMFLNALMRMSRNDVALAVTTPPTLPFLVAAACWIRRSSYILLIHDQYPDTLVAAGGVSPDAPIVRVMHAMNRRLFRGAARVIVVGRDMHARLEQTHPGIGPKIAVIQNWGETETIRPADRASNAILRERDLSDRFVLLYAGNLGRPNDLASIVEAAVRLERAGIGGRRVHLLFVGTGAKRAWLEREIRERGLSNMTLLGPRPRGEQMDFLNACDAALVPFVRGMWGVAVPSRLYNFLAAGKPIIAIAEPGSEVDLVVREEGVGWVTPPHDPDALLRTVLDAASDPERLQEMSLRARRAADVKYNGREALDAYRALVRDVWRESASR